MSSWIFSWALIFSVSIVEVILWQVFYGQYFRAPVETAKTKTLGQLIDEYVEDPTMEDFYELVEGDGS